MNLEMAERDLGEPMKVANVAEGAAIQVERKL